MPLVPSIVAGAIVAVFVVNAVLGGPVLPAVLAFCGAGVMIFGVIRQRRG